MDIYLAGSGWWKQFDSMGVLTPEICRRLKVLGSFYYKDDFPPEKEKYLKKYMLDSGAFSFRQKTKGETDWNAYMESYAKYVKEHKVEHYFELDIDPIIGYEAVKEMRNRLEEMVGWSCVPVWHPNRGKEDFIEMCQKYKYVALGGIVSSKSKYISYEKYFPWLIKTAHKYGATIHGLGYTHLSMLDQVHFDSVDSTSWLSGSLYGHHYCFTGNGIAKIDKPKGVRLKTRPSAVHNFYEWLKFSEWAETHL